MFSLFQGLNLGPSDFKTDDIPMYHQSSEQVLSVIWVQLKLLHTLLLQMRSSLMMSQFKEMF